MSESARTFRPGDTVGLEIDLRDKSGVGRVRARSEYHCADITAYDIHGNSTTHRPEGLSFRIQSRREDFAGPEFGEIRFTESDE